MLRDYQVKIVNEFLANPQCLQEVATGAGKTIMTAALSHSVEQYGRSIVIVPNKSLVTQTEKDYINMKLDVGVFFDNGRIMSDVSLDKVFFFWFFPSSFPLHRSFKPS